MKHLELIRSEYTDNYTIGTIGEVNKEPICISIELGWKDNQRNISCIPTGEYTLKKHASTKYNLSLRIWNQDGKNEIEGRTAILIHVGNYINYNQNGKILNDSEGCILPVTSIADKNKTGIFGASSAVQMKKLFDFVGEDTVKFTIRDAKEVKQSEQNNNTNILQEEKIKPSCRKFSYMEIKTTDGKSHKFPVDEIESITENYEAV